MNGEISETTETGSVSNSLREAIRQRGLTAYAAAKLAGVSVDAIQRFLNRQRGLTLTTVDKLASSLGLTLCPDDAKDQLQGTKGP
jgi:plasmid maintenance system antidote protein VapI